MTDLKDIAWKAAGAPTERTFAERALNIINVKDFGAVGDGIHDDRPHIQAAMDFLFPPTGSTVSNDASVYSKGSLYFPPGNYRCHTYSQAVPVNVNGFAGGYSVLTLNYGIRAHLYGMHMFGDSSATTRIFYDGPVDPGFRQITILLTLDTNVEISLIEGLHFDMGPSGAYPPIVPEANATLAVWNRGRLWGINMRAGHNNFWVDVKCSGATFGMGMGEKEAGLGSENIFYFCKWENNARGLCSFSSNSLGYNVIGGYCKNNLWGGIVMAQGVFSTVMGVEFVNNGGHTIADGFSEDHLGDWCSQNNQTFSIIGCESNSIDFTTEIGGPKVLIGNYHHGPSPGRFMFTKGSPVIMDSNWSTNGYLEDDLHQMDVGYRGVYLRANRFGAGGTSHLPGNWLTTGRVGIHEPVDPGDGSFNANY